MPAVFVHGVPETPAVWDPLLIALGRSDTVCLRLPGFGCPLPDGFTPAMDRYAEWLADELRAIEGPIDLVGHDWGAILTLRVVATHPTIVRSWIGDHGNLDESFTWHDTARVWQTPGEGEAFVEAWIAQPLEERAEGLVAAGVPHHAATTMASHVDATMSAAILSLYRSAVRIGTEWGPSLDGTAAPGLLVDAARDGYREPGRVAALATRIGAERVVLPDNGHFWMLEDPTRAAAFITEFWSRHQAG